MQASIHLIKGNKGSESESERKPFTRPANLCLSLRMLIVQEDIGFQRKTFNFLFTGNVICGADTSLTSCNKEGARTLLLESI